MLSKTNFKLSLIFLDFVALFGMKSSLLTEKVSIKSSLLTEKVSIKSSLQSREPTATKIVNLMYKICQKSSFYEANLILSQRFTT